MKLEQQSVSCDVTTPVTTHIHVGDGERSGQIIATRSVPVTAVQVEYKSSVSREEMFFEN